MSIQTASAYSGISSVPSIALNSTMDLNGVYVSPCGGRTFHVRGDGTSVLAYDDQYGQNTANMNQRLWPSVASVLPYCVANRGDTIIVHENHTENIGSADAWAFVAGLKIIGLGYGETRPTFTFTVAGATLVCDVAGLVIENCRFLCAGPAGSTALTVAAPFTWSGEGGRFIRNYCQVGIDNDQLCTAFFTTTAAADNLLIANNDIKGLAAAAAITSMFIFVGADGLRFLNNNCKAGFAGTTTALVDFETTASLDILVQGNLLHNWTSSGTGGLTCGAVATTGWILDNEFATETDGGTGIVPIVMNAACLIRQGRNYCSNLKQERGILLGSESA
jgi:hypothetical protein